MRVTQLVELMEENKAAKKLTAALHVLMDEPIDAERGSDEWFAIFDQRTQDVKDRLAEYDAIVEAHSAPPAAARSTVS